MKIEANARSLSGFPNPQPMQQRRNEIIWCWVIIRELLIGLPLLLGWSEPQSQDTRKKEINQRFEWLIIFSNKELRKWQITVNERAFVILGFPYRVSKTISFDNWSPTDTVSFCRRLTKTKRRILLTWWGETSLSLERIREREKHTFRVNKLIVVSLYFERITKQNGHQHICSNISWTYPVQEVECEQNIL